MALSFGESIRRNSPKASTFKLNALRSDAPALLSEEWEMDDNYLIYDEYSDENISEINDIKEIKMHPKQINLTQESNSQYIPFVASRYYDGFDFTTVTLSFHFTNKNGDEGYSAPINVAYNDKQIKFAWLVDNRVTSVEGRVDFEVMAVGLNSKGDDYTWRTNPCSLNVIKSLSGNGAFEPGAEWLNGFISKVAERAADMIETVTGGNASIHVGSAETMPEGTKILIDPDGEAYEMLEVDDTLTRTGYAADAAKVGTEINNIREDMMNFGGGSGTVKSVAGVEPDESGDVPLTPADIGAATEEQFNQLSKDIADNKNNIEKLIEVNSKRLIQGNEYDWTRGYFDANGHFNGAYYYRIAIKQWFAVEPGETYRFESNSTDKLLIRGYRGTTGYDFVETLVALESSKTITIPKSINHITITLSREEDGGDSIAIVNQMLADADAGLINPTVTRLFVSNSADSSQFVRTVNGISPDENGNVEIADLNLGGMSATSANLLIMILRNATYTTDQSDNIDALAAALSGEVVNPDVPDEPEEPEVTLVGISAEYTGGDVVVGTALNELTGISVIATYSDDSTATVTDYTLTGEITEGENTVTVTYEGLTAVFAVIGYVETSYPFTPGEPYAITWTSGYKVDNSTGADATDSGMAVSDYLPCEGASAFEVGTGLYLNYGLFFYDSDKNFLGRNGNQNFPGNGYAIDMKYPAAYVRAQKRTSATSGYTVTPVMYPVLTDSTPWEAGVTYNGDMAPGSLSTSTGAENNSSWYRSGFILCYGATTLSILPYDAGFRASVCWYDSQRNFISGATTNGHAADAVPENAYYFRFASAAYKPFFTLA